MKVNYEFPIEKLASYHYNASDFNPNHHTIPDDLTGDEIGRTITLLVTPHYCHTKYTGYKAQ